MKCIACGNRTVDYGVIEDFVFNIEEKYKVTVVAIGYDRYNALSSARKWDKKYVTSKNRFALDFKIFFKIINNYNFT